MPRRLPPSRSLRRRAGALAVAVGLLGVLPACAPTPTGACDGYTPRRLPGFVFGSAATDISTDAMTDAARLGYRWVRVPIRWAFLQPTVDDLAPLTRAQVAADPGLVERFAAVADWSIPDRVLAHAHAEGLSVIGFVGASSPPTRHGVELDPASIGVESYLAYQSLVTRAIVARYGPDHVGAPAGVGTISVWQTENELNIAPAATLLGIRRPAGLGAFLDSPWSSFAFQTDLLEALTTSVHAVDPAAVTTTNVNTDMNDDFNTLFGRPTWRGAVARWRTLVDVVGLDTYPNYFLATPVDGTIVGRRMRELKAVVCPGQQVMVTETNAPNGPVARGWSPERQAEFLAEAWESADAAGIDGFLPFGITQGDVTDPVMTAEDQANLDALGAALRDGDLAALGYLQLAKADWLATRMPVLTQAVEGHWGVARPDGTLLPAGEVVQRIAAATAHR